MQWWETSLFDEPDAVQRSPAVDPDQQQQPVQPQAEVADAPVVVAEEKLESSQDSWWQDSFDPTAVQLDHPEAVPEEDVQEPVHREREWFDDSFDASAVDLTAIGKKTIVELLFFFKGKSFSFKSG